MRWVPRDFRQLLVGEGLKAGVDAIYARLGAKIYEHYIERESDDHGEKAEGQASYDSTPALEDRSHQGVCIA